METAADAVGWKVRDVIRQLGPAEPDSVDGLLAAARASGRALDVPGRVRWTCGR